MTDAGRRHAPVSPPVALTIAGSDSGGGAGIQADLKTMEAAGAFGTSVVTAATAQNTRGVEDSHVLPVESVRAQYRAVVEDFDVAAVKTGMLATEPVVETVAGLLAGYDGPVVVDPVMIAASGDRLLTPAAERAYDDLIADATLVTPNADEAAALTDRPVETPADARTAGETLVEAGAEAALVKGGHLGGDTVVDTLVTAAGDGDGVAVERFEHPRVDTDATHGSGCALASAIAARLAAGADLVGAVAAGTAFMSRAVRYGLDVGEGPGAVNHAVELRERAARDRTAAAVADLAAAFVDRDVGPIVPRTGMALVGATRYAEAPAEAATVDGRLVRTADGAAVPRGVRTGGADEPAARLLLAAREHEPRLRFLATVGGAATCGSIERALEGPVVEAEGGDPAARLGAAVEAAGGTVPAAVVGADAAVLPAATADALRERVLAVLAAAP